jgi:hypothetical protein
MLLGRRLGATAVATFFVLSSQAAIAAPRPLELKLPNGNSAVVYADGVAHVFTKDRRESETTLVAQGPRYDGALRKAPVDKARLVEELSLGHQPPSFRTA